MDLGAMVFFALVRRGFSSPRFDRNLTLLATQFSDKEDIGFSDVGGSVPGRHLHSCSGREIAWTLVSGTKSLPMRSALEEKPS